MKEVFEDPKLTVVRFDEGDIVCASEPPKCGGGGSKEGTEDLF